ncbi:MAG: metal-dependent transcriptional regulator [Clostridia bacterium]
MKESGENYLETILLLTRRLECVRAVDVANELGYSKPSVSRALGILRDTGLVAVDDKSIRLTEAGTLAATAIYERHRVITRFLITTTGLDAISAEQDACRIEHVISAETFGRIRSFVENHIKETDK